MERKTVNVLSDVKDELTVLKSELGLSNESDTIKFLTHLYRSSENIPLKALNVLLELKR